MPGSMGSGGDAGSMSAGEDCVSLSSLATPDDQEQMAEPEVGDTVTYQVEGKVTRIENGSAYVKRVSVNGEPVAENKAVGAGAEPEEAEGAALRDEAAGTGGY